MRLVYVVNGLGVCGGVRIIVEHLNRLGARGHEVALLTTDGSTELSWLPCHFEIAGARSARGEELYQAADALVATEWSTAPFVAYGSSVSQRRFYFVQMRESLFARYGSWRDQAESTYRLPLKPITISRWLKRFLEEEYGHRDVPLIPNGVNLAAFYPDPSLPRAPGLRRVLVEGHEANAAKNVADAFRVIENLRARGQQLEVYGFNQVGPKHYPYDRFFLRPDQDLIRQLYSSSDLLLKTTRFEGRPLPQIEAMACGCPVVTTDMLALDDVAPEGLPPNALVSAVDDIAAMVGHAESLLRDEATRQSLIARARDYVRRELDWEPIVSRLEDVLNGPLS